MRDFRDPDGREWKVWGVMPTRRADVFLPETMATGWLCFESAGEKRRLHPIAEGWEALGEAQLWALCGRAEPVVRRPVPAEPESA